MRQIMTRVFLVISGAIALLIGITILFVPHALFATNQIALGTDPNLLSEIRAPGGLLIALGLVMGLGGCLRRCERAGLFTAAIAFLSYGVSRLISVAIDGPPATSLLFALAIELIVGLVAVLLLIPTRARRSQMRAGRKLNQERKPK